MRTKHLFTALALVALFASCAKEEFAPVSNVESSERAVVENVSFNFVESATTRLFFDGKYKWEAGDQLGACLMDEIVTPAYYDDDNAWNARFNLVDYIQTNYKFTRDAEGNWETEAKLCEGNYFLAYPYNKNKGLREAYTFECADQTLEGTTTPELMDAFVKNTSFVGYAPVAANNNDNESVAVDMVPVFESTGFTIKNTGTDSYTIEKIVLSGDKVMTYAKLAPKAKGLETELDDDDNYYKFDNVDALSYGGDGNDRIDVAIKSGNTIAPQDEINVIVMSAPVALEKDVLEQAILEIHTDKGLIRGIDLAKKYSSLNGSNSTGTGSTVNVLTDKALVALGVADKIHVTFDDTSLDIPDNMEVGSTDELYRLIRWNSKVTNTTITANLTANVTLTAEMYNILKNKYVANGSTLKFAGSKIVTIDADVESDAMDLITFNNSNVVVKGTQTITKSTATTPVTVDILVKSGATLNVNALLESAITNEGTVNVNIAYKRGAADSYYTVNSLTNKATVNVAGHKLCTVLTNSLKASVMNVEEGTTFVANAASANNGTINNYGIIKGDLTNNKWEKKSNGTYKYYPTINNYGSVAGITNHNVIVMKVNTASVGDPKGTDGEIDNTVESPLIREGENTVFVKANNVNASTLAERVLNAGATKVYISGTMTIDPAEGATQVDVTKVTEVVADDDLVIAGKGKVYFDQNPLFTVEAGTETVVKNGATLSIGKGSMIANGTLTIEKNAQVICGTYQGNIKDYGTLNVKSAGNAQELANTLENAPAGSTVVLSKDVDYGTITAGELKNIVIKGSEGAKLIFKADANTKIENVTLQEFEFEYTGSTVDFAVVVDANAQVDNLVIENCTFVGTGAKAGRGLSGYNNNASIEFKNCTFKDLGYPIYAWGGYKSLNLENCTFENIKSWAIMPQSGFDGDMKVTGCTFKDCLGGGLIKAGTLTANHTFTFTNNTITGCTVAGDHNWFQFNTSAGTKVIEGNTKDESPWTPGVADGLK